MSQYIFNIHKKGSSTLQAVDGKVEADGWVKSEGMTSDVIASIPDTVDKVSESGKIGTSIPTPLARIYLFKAAFRAMNAMSSNPDMKTSSYAQLVSDCLDVLQLLFEKGCKYSNNEKNESKIKFVTKKIKNLVDDLNGNKAHELLGKSLDLAFKSSDLKDEITLIEYDGILLGGLSPFTLVYTSPNLRREIKARREGDKEFDFSSNDNKSFCDNTPRSLSERSVDFQEYVKQLIANSDVMRLSESSFCEFKSYVDKQLGVGDYVASPKYAEDYKCFSPSLKVADVELRWNNKLPNLENSYFMMLPNKKVKEVYERNGGRAIPLFLPVKFSKNNCKYIDSDWDINTDIDSTACIETKNGKRCVTPFEGRYLPKNGGQREASSIKYPWVSEYDFLYDNIIDLNYSINTDKYNNALANEDGVSFLLPIRKEYFMFFDTNDLKRNLTVKPTYKKTGNMSSLQSVNISLKIPVKGSGNRNEEYVEVTREYKLKRSAEEEARNDSIYPIKQYSFGMGVFPFYQLSKESGLRNQYSIYMLDKEEDQVSLDFYGFDNPKKLLEIADKEVRTSAEVQSWVYVIRKTGSGNNSFDIIEVTIKEDKVYSALIIPNWTEYKPTGKDTMISVDFGTSNTHIAYYADGVAKPFVIDRDEMQMVLLNNAMECKDGWKKTPYDYRDGSSFGDIGLMSQYLREFVPSVIGPMNKQGVEYPVKTATLSSTINIAKCNGEKAKLFADVNIGYDINYEPSGVPDHSEYKTDLKWAAQEARTSKATIESSLEMAKRHVNAYCEQTLWMVKNMIVIKGFNTQNVRILYFYPESMEKPDREMFKKAWDSAVEKIFSDCNFKVEIESELESIAPFYSLIETTELGSRIESHNTINIDIGGGTTDIFIFDKNNESEKSGKYAYEASVQFAGDNIWGAELPRPSKGNGFVRYMMQKIEKGAVTALDEDLYKKFRDRLYIVTKAENGTKFKVKNGDTADKDMASFLFKNAPNAFKEKIQDNSELKKTLLLHYASIIYYVTDILKCIKKDRPDFEIPDTMTFTGKGSEYIKIISSDVNEISDLTYYLFQAFGLDIKEFEKKDFAVVFSPNPKTLTAEGGIYKYKQKSKPKRFAKPEERISDTGDYEIVRYEQIGQKALGFTPEEGKDYYADEVKTYQKEVMAHFDKFVEAIYGNAETSLRKTLEDSDNTLRDIYFDPTDADFIKKSAKESYKVLSENYKEGKDHKKLRDNIFFLAVKNMIIDFSNKNV